jgi:hypothetical protein
MLLVLLGNSFLPALTTTVFVIRNLRFIRDRLSFVIIPNEEEEEEKEKRLL